jgi:hypothetical protein
MRTMNNNAMLALNSRALGLALLVEMSLTQPLRVATCRDDVVWDDGHGVIRTFIGGKQTFTEPVKDQGGEVAGMRFDLSGVPADTIAIALAEPVQGKLVQVWTAVMATDTAQLLDVLPLWAGTLDQMPISQSGESATVSVTAEHRGLTFARPRGLQYTDGDQQRLFPGDKCLEYMVSQASRADTWPAAIWFKQ